MTQTAAPITTAGWLPCDCSPIDVGDHKPSCVLGRAETIAHEAAEHARVHGDHVLLAVVTALIEADLIGDDDKDELVLGVLDALWDADALRDPDGAP